MKMLTSEILEYSINIRRIIHENPELSFQEYETTDLICRELESFGIEVTRWEDLTGAVGFLRGGKVGPTIGLRADIDALPLQELTDKPYSSKRAGVMHACAHDAHTAILLGTAKYLSTIKNQLAGNIKFIFQPAEETPPGGAITMIKKGVLENPKVDAIFALHHATEIKSGQIGICYGQFLASADQFTLTINVKGGGGSAPHKGVDGIMVATEIINALQIAMNRRIDPVKSALISFGTINGGTKFNILADRVVITGTARSLDPEVSQQIPQIIKEIASGIASIHDGNIELEYEYGYPTLINDNRMTEILEKSASEAIGKENVLSASPIMAGDDLAYFFRKVPGSYFWLGITPKTGVIAPAHTTKFDIDEKAIGIGLKVMSTIAIDAMNEL